MAAYPEYHPQQRYAKRDLQHFANKVKAGADSAITQFFFNPDAYFHFVDEVRALGVEVPIVPGVMPFHNYAKIAQFAARDGIEIPRWVALKMEGFMDDTASIRAFGLDVVERVCRRLVEGGAPGLHFYTLNQSALALELCRRLARPELPKAPLGALPHHAVFGQHRVEREIVGLGAQERQEAVRVADAHRHRLAASAH